MSPAACLQARTCGGRRVCVVRWHGPLPFRSTALGRRRADEMEQRTGPGPRVLCSRSRWHGRGHSPTILLRSAACYVYATEPPCVASNACADALITQSSGARPAGGHQPVRTDRISLGSRPQLVPSRLARARRRRNEHRERPPDVMQ
jgi:hypothetical protein